MPRQELPFAVLVESQETVAFIITIVHKQRDTHTHTHSPRLETMPHSLQEAQLHALSIDTLAASIRSDDDIDEIAAVAVGGG